MTEDLRDRIADILATQRNAEAEPDQGDFFTIFDTRDNADAVLTEVLPLLASRDREIERLGVERDSMVTDLYRALYPGDARPDRPIDTVWTHCVHEAARLAELHDAQPLRFADTEPGPGGEGGG